jgi:hypothetical protein
MERTGAVAVSAEVLLDDNLTFRLKHPEKGTGKR